MFIGKLTVHEMDSLRKETVLMPDHLQGIYKAVSTALIGVFLKLLTMIWTDTVTSYIRFREDLCIVPGLIY